MIALISLAGVLKLIGCFLIFFAIVIALVRFEEHREETPAEKALHPKPEPQDPELLNEVDDIHWEKFTQLKQKAAARERLEREHDERLKKTKVYHLPHKSEFTHESEAA